MCFSARLAAVGTLSLLHILAGCASPARVTVDQPFAPPRQQRLELESDWAYHAADGSLTCVLLAFPLPGSKAGPRDFFLYLRAPVGESNVNEPAADGSGGFFLQVVGALAGKSRVTGGRVHIGKVLFQPRKRRLEFSLQLDDGSTLAGKALTREDGPEVHAFERRYSGDVALLAPATSQPASRAAPTASRPSGP